MIITRKLSNLLIILSISWFTVFCQETPGDIVAGEKLFNKVLNKDGKTCADCHYFTEPDSLDWNPSAPALASRVMFYRKDGLGKFFVAPEGKVLKQAHDGCVLSEIDEVNIISYMASLNTELPVPKQPFKIRLILVIAVILILICLSIDKRRFHWIPVLIRKIMVFLMWVIFIVIIVDITIAFNRAKDYAPVQPIKFSHQIHSTGNKIECNYCHSGVLKGRNAGIPAVSLCMNCHKHVKEGTRSGFFEIRKITQAFEDSIPVRWIRIHNLPDFTYFNHMQHVKIGMLDCTECHGDVKNVHIVKQEEDLSMGWCLKCHDTRAVDFSNEYYQIYYRNYYDSLQSGKIDSVMVSQIGGRECGKCHQ
ncbi:MAG: hypothetical protein A2X05_17615 [Bacteroidetes bacterium GWE2_41_25]|nr:MAG: hypothetical protein A2X03_14980 [Bacteroidetes bacterium GWA2_40_15]OFX94529.1 MAG: hypothetical protein A2X06_15415 [Bacteroidetes bacterium GWC2_40_22]OFX96578.1 MAG: hypothetical protein A2X05_17615 [Bacteroidetes bacterium GWE2_41_25]OFY59454.1 MAG: hypothetical protein A2X04_06545 [Bacteroidetes bacterium GWF2_41_9]HAM10701.1 hypothetical protein [Bacteroidales bacterium]